VSILVNWSRKKDWELFLIPCIR